jgi:hypothetical protein
MTNQTMADIHDSTTCALGPGGRPCDMCWWANHAAKVDKAELLGDIRQDHRYASLSAVRMAIFDVIDSGDRDQQPWALYENDHGEKFLAWTEDQANRERQLFADAVVARIAALQSPPHNLDAGLRARLAQGAKGEKR